MTVRELFDHFENYFSKISYRDYDSYQTKHLANEDFESLTDEFLRDHSEDSVTQWMYRHSDNSLYLVISRW